MLKNASNQKTDATLKKQLFKIYNFVSVKDGSASISNVAHATFYLEAELNRDKVQFQNLRRGRIFLGQATKL